MTCVRHNIKQGIHNVSFGNRGVSLFNLQQRVEFLQEHLSATRRNAPSIISDMSLREFYDGSQPRKTRPLS